jgi:hypothetical protein
MPDAKVPAPTPAPNPAPAAKWGTGPQPNQPPARSIDPIKDAIETLVSELTGMNHPLPRTLKKLEEWGK